MIDEGAFYHWGPLLWRTKLDKEFCDELFERAKKTNIKANAYLAGHIEDEYEYLPEDLVWCAEKLSPYVQNYLNAGRNWYKDIRENTTTIRLEQLWINYMRKGDSNPIHIHQSNISFVIYLKVPDALNQEKNFSPNSGAPGSIIFVYGENLDNFITSYEILPEEGDMFMFPSQLRHLVFPFRSDVVRVSVSGNLFWG
jgi:uncharacterized protein (TIGR02466 family)